MATSVAVRVRGPKARLHGRGRVRNGSERRLRPAFRTERVWSSVRRGPGPQIRTAASRPPVGSETDRDDGSADVPGPDGFETRLRSRFGSADQVDGFTAGGRVWKRIERRLRPAFRSGRVRTAASRPRFGSADQVGGFTVGGRVWKRIGRRLRPAFRSGRVGITASRPRSQVRRSGSASPSGLDLEGSGRRLHRRLSELR